MNLMKSYKFNINNSYFKSYSINSTNPPLSIMWLGFDKTHYKPINYSVKIEETSKSEKLMQSIVKRDLKDLKMDWKNEKVANIFGS